MKHNALQKIPASIGALFLGAVCLVLALYIPFRQGFHVGVSLPIALSYAAVLLTAAAFVFLCARVKPKAYLVLAGIFALTFAYQFCFSLAVNPALETDLSFYYGNALYYAEHGVGAPQLYQALFPGTATYPAFLSLFMRVFGEGRMTPVILNQLAMCGCACLAYLLCKKIMSTTWALSAAMLIAVHPFTIIYSNTCNAEMIFAFLMLASCFMSTKLFKDGLRWKPLLFAALTGLLCGVSNLFRPLGLIMLIAVLLVQTLHGNGTIKRRTAICCAALAAYLLCGVFNGQLTRYLTKYDPPKSGYGWNLYVGASGDGVWNEADAAEFGRVFEELGDPSKIQSYFAEKAFQRYRDMGIQTIPHSVHKLRHWLSGEYMAAVAASREPEKIRDYNALIRAVDEPVLLLGLIGGVLVFLRILRRKSTLLRQEASLESHTFKRRDNILLVPAYYLCGSFIALMLLEAAPRYTVSYRPLFCVLAVYALNQLIRVNPIKV